MTQVLTPLELRYIDGKTWVLTAPFRVYSDVLGGELTIPAGFKTDFNSVPLGLWNILPPTAYGHAALPHDQLYQTGEYAGQPIDRETADRVHREFVIFDKAPDWKVRLYFRGLRLGGWWAWRNYRKADVLRSEFL